MQPFISSHNTINSTKLLIPFFLECFFVLSIVDSIRASLKNSVLVFAIMEVM